MRRVWTIPAAIAALTLTACAGDASSDATSEGARAAVEAYVAAIEAGDLETATAMTDPEALEPSADSLVDVTAALPQVVEPMRDAWLSYSGTDFTRLDEQSNATTDVVWWTVSYVVGDVPGSGSVQVTRVGDDPADAASWLVTDALLSDGAVLVQPEVGEATFGDVDLGASDTGAHSVWGYPGTYVLEAAVVPAGATIDPLEIHLGVDDGTRWDRDLPRLEVDRP